MKKRKWLYKLDFISSFFIGILLIICVWMYPKVKDDLTHKEQIDLYDELVQNHIDTSITPSATPSNSIRIPETPTPTEAPKILPHLAVLLERNEDIIGWINIPDTPINYPLTQHTDNQYYLEHNSAKEISAYGSIYVDYRNDKCFSNKNTLIYGHNMKNGTMFHELIKYKEEAYFRDHPYIYVSDLYETFVYEVFSVYVVDADTETVEVEYESDEAFMAYIKSCQARSKWPNDVDLKMTDQIITLVTCSYESNNARTLVQAKLIS